MDFKNLTQVNLDKVKALFPENKELQQITLANLIEYSKGKDPKGSTAQIADTLIMDKQGGRVLPITDCQWAIGGVVVDCIFVITGAVGLHGKLPPSAIEEVVKAINPEELSEIEKMVQIIADPKSSNTDIAKNVFYIGKTIYTGGSFEAIYRAIYNSLTPWDMALYGTLGIAELVAVFLTDGAALIALIVAEIAQVGFLVSDSIKVVQECDLAI